MVPKKHSKEVHVIYGNFKGKGPKKQAYLKGKSEQKLEFFQQDWVVGFETKKGILMFSGTTPYGRAVNEGRNT